jgi:hypothetical protein
MFQATKMLNGVLIALSAVTLAACATSGTKSESSAAPPAATAVAAPTAPAATAAPTASSAHAKRTADQITVDELIDNAQEKAILAKHAPKVASDPRLEQVRGMTLTALAANDEAQALGLTAEVVTAIVDDVNRL